MKHFLTLALLCAVSFTQHSCTEAKAEPMGSIAVNLGRTMHGASEGAADCVGGKDIVNDTMDNAPFTVNLPQRASRDRFQGGYPSQDAYSLLTLWTDLTDANTSITQFDITCTVDQAKGADDFTPQVCGSGSTVATCVQVDTGFWQKASPGTKKWPTRIDVFGYPDVECVLDVGAGTGASADAIVVDYTLCTY